jgi:hypothetical protein
MDDLLVSSPGQRRRRLIPGQQDPAGQALLPMWLALGGTLVLALVIAAAVTLWGLRAVYFRV